MEKNMVPLKTPDTYNNHKLARLRSPLLMQIARMAVIASICCYAYLPATAQTATFDEAVATIMRHDLQTKATMLSARSELASSRADNTLADPEIEFSYLWGTPEVGNKWTAGISQSFEWPGVYSARRDANKAMNEAVEKLDRTSYCERRCELESSLISLIGVRKKIELLESLKENVDTLLALTTEGFTKGETTRLDINKLKIEQVAVVRQLSEMYTERERLLSSLSAFNGGKRCDHIAEHLDNYPHATLGELNEYIASVTEGAKGEYAALTARAAMARSKAARRSALPGFSLGYVYENEMDGDFHGFSAGITLPVYNSRRRIEAARLEQEAAGNASQSELNDLVANIEGDYHTARRLRDDIAQYGPLLVNTDHFTLIHKAYTGGEMSILDYLQEVNYYTEAKLTYADMEQQYHLLLANLSKYLH